jgi:D-alanyl-D-alanine carboxypeptidase
MKKIFFGVIIALCVCVPQKSKSQNFDEKIEAFMDSLYMKNKKSIGISIHVESPKRGISHSFTTGYSDKTQKHKLETNEPGLIASNIKTFVSATILKLIENGKLKIDQPINELLSSKTLKLFKSDGYQLQKIKVFHLLSHTSGIGSYVDDDYIDFVNKNPTHRWTRQEQLLRTVEVSDPLDNPGMVFKYADVNYLLLTEIIQEITGKPFYKAMRDVLNYSKLNLNDLWMPTLEKKPTGVQRLVNQYWDTYQWDSSKIDISWDLYGGGGIACTPENLSRFIYQLFNHKIIQDKNVLDLIYKKVEVEKPWIHPYYMGIYEESYRELKGYGHGGFWGTKVIYFPKIDTSISVFILERDKKDLQPIIINRIIDVIN